MKKLERFALVDRIGRELQQRMSYPDITAYLQSMGVDVNKPTSGVNSKWIYTKELLASEPIERVLAIAEELEIPHGYVMALPGGAVESSSWDPHHFRLFLCHLALFRRKTAALQAALKRFGISAFVAHVDIEPTTDWQDEIEACLWSMDALAAILMPGFKESNWTSQEVGVAMGRGVLVIPIMRGLEPFGFISKIQALNASGKSVAQVASDVFDVLIHSSKTRTRMLTCLIDTTLRARDKEEALNKLGVIASIADLPNQFLERLKEGAPSSGVFAEDDALDALNRLLGSRGLKPVKQEVSSVFGSDDDLPF